MLYQLNYRKGNWKSNRIRGQSLPSTHVMVIVTIHVSNVAITRWGKKSRWHDEEWVMKTELIIYELDWLMNAAAANESCWRTLGDAGEVLGHKNACPTLATRGHILKVISVAQFFHFPTKISKVFSYPISPGLTRQDMALRITVSEVVPKHYTAQIGKTSEMVTGNQRFVCFFLHVSVPPLNPINLRCAALRHFFSRPAALSCCASASALTRKKKQLILYQVENDCPCNPFYIRVSIIIIIFPFKHFLKLFSPAAFQLWEVLGLPIPSLWRGLLHWKKEKK